MLTKRKVLSISAFLSDPVGWLLPIVINLRIDIQRMWEEGFVWDDNISQPTQEQFAKIFSALEYLNQEHITELLSFSDASGDGYDAVLFYRIN